MTSAVYGNQVRQDTWEHQGRAPYNVLDTLVQGYFAQKTHPPPRTLQEAYLGSCGGPRREGCFLRARYICTILGRAAGRDRVARQPRESNFSCHGSCHVTVIRAASERRGSNFQGFEDLCLKAKVEDSRTFT